MKDTTVFLVSATPLKPLNRISWNFVVMKDWMCRYAFLQEMLIWSFWGAIYVPFFVRLPVTNACNCHSLYIAFSSNVGAWGMWACSLFLSFRLLLLLYMYSIQIWTIKILVTGISKHLLPQVKLLPHYFLVFDEPHWIYFFYSDRSRIHKTINQHKKSEETSPCLLRSSTCVYTRWKLFDSGYLMSTNRSDLPWGGLGVCVSHMGKLLRFGLKKRHMTKFGFFKNCECNCESSLHAKMTSQIGIWKCMYNF